MAEHDGGRLARVGVVIGTGIFVTGLGWPGLMGRLPFGLLLKNQLHLAPEKVAAFWAVGTMAWYGKPLFGLICDAWPLFGSRRRGYVLLGAAAAAIGWAAFAVLPPTYGVLMAVMTALNVGLVLASASVGGMLVEEGQRYGATGRLSALHTALEGAMSLVAGPLGAALAVRTLGVTALAGAALVALMIPVTLALYREPRTAPPRPRWARATDVMKPIGRSRSLGMAALLIFLVYLSPGLQTSLLYYQQDVLKLDVHFIGILQLAGGAGALAGAGLYVWLCRRLPLRWSLVGGIVLEAAAALLYLRYRSATSALLIDATAGLVGALGTLPLYDLAVRSTPKGSESFGFALMMSVRTIALFAISDPLGSLIYSHFDRGFDKLVLANAGSTLAVLLFVPLLPAALLNRREGQST